jgi:hypothetical protein
MKKKLAFSTRIVLLSGNNQIRFTGRIRWRPGASFGRQLRNLTSRNPFLCLLVKIFLQSKRLQK